MGRIPRKLQKPGETGKIYKLGIEDKTRSIPAKSGWLATMYTFKVWNSDHLKVIHISGKTK